MPRPFFPDYAFRLQFGEFDGSGLHYEIRADFIACPFAAPFIAFPSVEESLENRVRFGTGRSSQYGYSDFLPLYSMRK
jgi:hypothetical protein